MIALLAAIVLAQSTLSVQLGKEKQDSASRAKSDSLSVIRQERRDSVMAKARARDSSRKATRLAKRPPITPAVLASAFKDARARDLLRHARAARLTQDSTLTGYDASAYERMSVGMGFKKIGRDRLLMRSERAAHVVWRRDKGAIIDVKGQRSAFPMLEGVGHGDANFGSMGDIPYYPGRETLWIGSGLAKADVSENEMIHPLATGAEAYYTYASGDSVGFQLPGGQRIELRELLIRPRQPKWNVAVGSLWFDASTAQLVRAVYRMAQEMDIMAVAKEANEEDHDPDDDIPRWVKPMITPMKAMVTAITVEYGLHEGRFWLPRSQTVEGDAQVSFMHIPFKLEQRYSYASVNGTEPLPLPELTIAVADTASDSVSRAARRERRRSECKTGTERIRRENRSDEGLRILIRVPCDTVALAHSSELPKSIYDDGEAVFGTAERDALVSEALTLGAQPEFAPQRATFSYGLPYTRFNRIEGFSTGLAADQVLGRGYSAHAQLRLGLADLSPNGELWLDRTDGRQTLGVGIYRRLVASNDWGDPLGFSSSVSALLFGRDEGFYYRTWGAELKGQKDLGIINNWRLFGEQHFDAAVKTEFSVSHPGGVKGDLTNINAVNGTIVGLAVGHHSSHGLDPHGFRALTDVKLEGGAGTFDYSRGSLQTTLSHSLGSALDGALTLGAGTSGGRLPIQKHFFLGGVQTVRGQRAGAAIGDAFWMTSAEFGTSNVGIRKIVFGDLGWAGSRTDFSHPGRPLSGAGVGASFMDGLIRIDVAKGIYPEKAVRANLYVEARF
ncbi:MAG TPA: ShlB/FhaC/HecB family hemolysin secretion/activation protein [Gemmatimonadaceae bacterium]|nr:ShlB/FhaC/HecB family hemolysin secretion/activation protein [Gemmatimonadaceae bacterium]